MPLSRSAASTCGVMLTKAAAGGDVEPEFFAVAFHARASSR